MATDIDLRMGALGLRGAVWTTQGLQVALRSDAFWVQTGSAAADNLVATRADVRPGAAGAGKARAPWGCLGVRTWRRQWNWDCAMTRAMRRRGSALSWAAGCNMPAAG